MVQPSFQGRNINLVKQHNLQAILLNLLYEPVLSRVELARRLNLSNATITNLINELIADGIVVEIDADTETGELRSVGRPRTNICLEPNARYVVGIHIGVGIFRVGMANLRAELTHNHTQTFDVQTPWGEVLELIEAVTKTIIRESNIERERILGVGVGASGLVDFSTGVNLLAPNLNWHDVPLREELEKRLGFPVIVDNNVRAMAVAETYFGAGRGVDSVAFVYGRTGVGAGLTFQGRVFRGSSKGAGEIGHCIILPNEGQACRCGNRGCLETIVSESAILHEAYRIADENPNGMLAQVLKDVTDRLPIERVFDAARKGDVATRQMIDERAYYLGVALVNLINLFNPDLILLGGIFSRGQDLFIPTLSRMIEQMAFGGMGKRVRLQPTSFGWKAGVIGASSLALLHFFFQQADSCLS